MREIGSRFHPIVVLSLAIALSGCSLLPGLPTPTVAPTIEATIAPGDPTAPPTPTTQPTEAAPVATLPPSVTPAPTLAAPPATVATAPTPAPAASGLLTYREDQLLLGDGWGTGARQVLALGTVASLAFSGTRVAYVANRSVLVADLPNGKARRVSDAPPSFVLGPDLVWTADGGALLTIADHEDANAKSTGRSIDIGVVALPDGPWRPGLALADKSGVTILQAPRAGGSVLLVAWGNEPSFKEALRYDLSSGRLLATLPVAGEGDVVPSPDAQMALTSLFDSAKGVSALVVYDLTNDKAPVRYRLEHAARTHAVSYVWSPDGTQVAFLLREGRASWDNPGKGLGIWVWDLEAKKASKVAEASEPASGPVAWTADGHTLIYRQVDAAGGGAYYALALPEAKARVLPIDPASRILGWLPAR